jgi:hypothetical protein
MKYITLLVFLNACANIWCQAPVPKEALAIRKSFDDKIATEVSSLRASVMAPIERRYLDALKSGIKAVQQSGNLEELKLFQAEIEQLESFQANPGTTLTDDVSNPPPTFGKLRGIYLNEVAKFESDVFRKVSSMYKSQEQALKDLAMKLTRQGLVGEADATMQELKFMPLARCQILGGMIKTLAEGQLCYTNRDYAWTEVSPNLANLSFNMTAGGVSQTSVIRILRPGLMYVACGTDDAEDCIQQLHKLGFKKTREYFLQKPRGGSGMSVFSKFVVQGFTLPTAIRSFSGFIIIGNLESKL